MKGLYVAAAEPWLGKYFDVQTLVSQDLENILVKLAIFSFQLSPLILIILEAWLISNYGLPMD